MKAKLRCGFEIAARLQPASGVFRVGQHGRGRNPEQRQAIARAHRARETEVAMPARLFGDRRLLGRSGEPCLDQQLVLREGGLHHAGEEPGGWDDTISAGRARDHVPAEGQQHGGQLRGGIGVGQASAYGAAVADHAMRNQPHGSRKQWTRAGDELRVFDISLACEGLYRNSAVALVDAVEVGRDVEEVNRIVLNPDIEMTDGEGNTLLPVRQAVAQVSFANGATKWILFERDRAILLISKGARTRAF